MTRQLTYGMHVVVRGCVLLLLIVVAVPVTPVLTVQGPSLQQPKCYARDDCLGSESAAAEVLRPC